MIQYLANGSAYCVDDADAARTTTIAGPVGSGAQRSAIAAFFAQSSYVPPSDIPADFSVAAASPGTSTFMARSDHVHAARVQRMMGTTDGSGQVTAVWPVGFTGAPVPNAPAVLDAAGGRYAFSVLSNSPTQCVYQITKQRTLPTPLTLLTALIGYDTFQPAPAGLTVYCSAGPAT